MIDRPDATQLLEAMAATLTDKVMPELSGGAQHQARIVANLCRIVARDLADDATDTDICGSACNEYTSAIISTTCATCGTTHE